VLAPVGLEVVNDVLPRTRHALVGLFEVAGHVRRRVSRHAPPVDVFVHTIETGTMRCHHALKPE